MKALAQSRLLPMRPCPVIPRETSTTRADMRASSRASNDDMQDTHLSSSRMGGKSGIDSPLAWATRQSSAHIQSPHCMHQPAHASSNTTQLQLEWGGQQDAVKDRGMWTNLNRRRTVHILGQRPVHPRQQHSHGPPFSSLPHRSHPRPRPPQLMPPRG